MTALEATEAAFNELNAVADSPPAPSDAPPETPAVDSSTPVPATAEQELTPAPTESPESPVPVERPAGPIPYERHKAVLESARQEAERIKAEYQNQLKELEWARSVDRTTFENQQRLWSLAESDPVAFRKLYDAALEADPRYAGLTRPVAQPVPDPRPDPDILLEDGRKLYSAEQQERLLEWQRQELQREFAPVVQTVKGQQAMQAAMQRVLPVLQEARATWPKFREHEAEMRQVMQTRGVSLHEAYQRVVVPKLTVPAVDETKIREDERQKVLAELRSKPAIAPEHPSSAVMSAPRKSRKDYATTGELVREVYESLSRSTE